MNLVEEATCLSCSRLQRELRRAEQDYRYQSRYYKVPVPLTSPRRHHLLLDPRSSAGIFPQVFYSSTLSAIGLGILFLGFLTSGLTLLLVSIPIRHWLESRRLRRIAAFEQITQQWAGRRNSLLRELHACPHASLIPNTSF